jgi:hypothetical protein
MANSLLPPEERNLTPDQVEALDKRRDLGHTFLVIAGQFAVIATILLLWVGQDLSYSPGWAHPIAYYFALAVGIIVVFGISGIVLRRGTPRIDETASNHQGPHTSFGFPAGPSQPTTRSALSGKRV